MDLSLSLSLSLSLYPSVSIIHCLLSVDFPNYILGSHRANEDNFLLVGQY